MRSKYAGYMGKVMLVDLTSETVTEYPWSDEQRELYLGGKIMAARILCDHLTGPNDMRGNLRTGLSWFPVHKQPRIHS